MTAVQELLVDVLVTATAIAGSQPSGNHEPVVVLLLLVRSGLMALQAIHAFQGVSAHLVLVHNRVLRTRMTLGAFTGRAHQRGIGLLGLSTWPCTVNEKCCQDKGKCDYDGQKHRSKRHSS